MISLKAFLIIIPLLIAFTRQYKDIIDQFMSTYEDRLHHFNESLINFSTNGYLVTLTDVSMILNCYALSRTQSAFSFKDAAYAVLFNIFVKDASGLTISRRDFIIEHTFQLIHFTAETDNTFLVYFTDDRFNCTFFTQDLLRSTIFHIITEAQENICRVLSQILKNKITIFTHSMPWNEEAFNFEDLHSQLKKHGVHLCDYPLNATHRVIDISFTELTYASQEKRLDFSDFRYVNANFNYTLISTEKEIQKEKGVAIFQFIAFGKGKIEFTFFPKDNADLTNLLSGIIYKFESTRTWIRAELY